MNETNTGGPAFPTPRYERGDMYSLGMTLRDYFAAKVMQGLIAADRNYTKEKFATIAYTVADAMMKARDA
jgi:hypothetical protein